MPPRTKHGELPKPMIKPGSFGCLPLNPLTLAYLHAEQTDLLLGYRDTTDTESFKTRPSIYIQNGAKRQALSLDGKFFNGHSEALYRGLLPEVILAAPDEMHWADFLRDFVEYLGKIVAMGFFYPKKYLLRRNPVDEHIPCTILTGNGLLFSRFITGLVQELNKMAHDYPILDETTRIKILGRFVRGIPENGHNQAKQQDWWLDPTVLQVPVGRTISLPLAPQAIRIAGGNPYTQGIIQTVLAAHGLTAILETHCRNAVERLEFENILWRVSNVIIPTLATTAAEKKELSPKATEGILSMGRQRQAFDANDNVDKLLGRFNQSSLSSPIAKKVSKPAASQRDTIAINGSDADMLRGLGSYAASLGMSEEQQLYESLASRIPNE
jgi:hypothetical protein